MITLTEMRTERFFERASATRADRWERTFVWVVWAMMFVVAVAYTWWFGYRYATFWDEWNLVPNYTGVWPNTWQWLWQPYNEHRIPLPKLILISLNRAFHFDFRAGCLFNVLSLGFVSLIQIWAVRRMRGRTVFSDAFFAIAWLSWAQSQNLLFGFQVQFICSTLFAGTLLAIVAAYGTRLPLGIGLLAALYLILLPLCGANGLSFAVMMGTWLAVCAVKHLLSGDLAGRLTGALLSLAIIISGSLVVYYFVNFDRLGRHEAAPDASALIRVAVQFFAYSLGPVTRTGWPYWGAATIAVLFLSLLAGGFVLRRQPGQRLRMLGLLLFLYAGVGLVFAITWGRTGSSPDAGIEVHYVVLTTSLWCCMYFIWGSLSRPVGRVVQFAIFLTFVGLLYGNMTRGYYAGQSIKLKKAKFISDLHKPISLAALAERYTNPDGPWLCPPALKTEFSFYLQCLRNAGIGPFAKLPDESEINLPINNLAFDVHEMTWDGRAGSGTSTDPYLILKLDRPQRVTAIRLRMSYENTASPKLLQVYWRLSSGEVFNDETRTHRQTLRGDGVQTITIPVDSELDEIRLDPDSKPVKFVVEEITLSIQQPAAGDPVTSP
jgi:hypothetical protein